MFKLDLEKAEEPEINCQHPLDHWKSERVPGKHLLLLYWLRQSVWLCGSQQTVENSSRDGNTRPPYLSPEKSVCRPRSNNQNLTWSNWLVPNLLRSTTRLSTVTVLIICRVRHGNARLEESQAGIKIARRNIKNFRYSDDTTLMAESRELKSVLMKIKEESGKVCLKLNIMKTKITASGPITSWQIDGEIMQTMTGFTLGGLQNHCRWWLHPWN